MHKQKASRASNYQRTALGKLSVALRSARRDALKRHVTGRPHGNLRQVIGVCLQALSERRPTFLISSFGLVVPRSRAICRCKKGG